MATKKQLAGGTLTSRRSKQIRRKIGTHTPKNINKESTIPMDRIGEARTIIYVHGIGNKPEQSILKCQWDRALFGFDLGERSRLAYWVNREFYPEPLEATCDSGDKVNLEEEPTGKGINIQNHLATVSLQDEVRAVTSDPAKQKVLLNIAKAIENGDKIKPPPSELVRIGAQRVGAKILPIPAVLRKWISRKLVRAFIRDSNDYFFVPSRRKEMRESVLARLRVGGGPFIVIAHSQGSMIAYDVLSELEKNELDIRLFVTIGSPLGITEVQDHLKTLTGQTQLAVPSCVSRWVNVADPLDPVALDKRLSGDFEPTGRIEDDVEFNVDSPFSPHSGSGYLQTEPVRDCVRESVATGLFQPVADFVIARDLTRDLENCPRQFRHPTLIELVDPGRANGVTLDTIREKVIGQIRKNTEATEAELRLEPLRHYVSADLTREEIESLASNPILGNLKVGRVWRNARKTALLELSVNTVQAQPAHTGYQAFGRGITWAVLDTGIVEHPHFKTNNTIEAQYDCTRGKLKDGGTAIDENGHGTHVAGIIAGYYAIQNNGQRPRVFSGMAPEAKLRIYKVLDKQGSGEDAWIIKALDHITETNEKAGRPVVQGVNLSLGGPFDQSVFGCGHSPLCRELRRLWRQGVVVVLAAGNEGFTVLQTLEGTVDANMDLSIGDPANLEEAIAVGSIHKENPHTYGVSYFSSRGPTADGRQKPDLVAPGERVLSCRHRLKKSATTVEDLYVEMSGTSMAAPHVSGIIAAYLSVRKEFIGEPDRVKQTLLDNCTDLKRDRPQQGAGMPNLVKMLVNT
jgi:subtilisin family serine protease